MKDNPFKKFPPKFRPLIDGLPPPDEQGIITLGERDRDSIVVAILQLGDELRYIQSSLDAAREADDLDSVRKSIAVSLIAIQKHLLPIYGADLTWPIKMSIEALECAVQGKRHPLMKLPHEESHFLQDISSRLGRKALAAATLDFFYGRLPNLNQEQIGEQIAEAMGRGGFHVRSNRVTKPPSGRTVQDWRNLYLPGRRNGERPTNSEAKGLFQKLLVQLEIQQGSTRIEDYFNEVLDNITVACRAVL